MTAPQRALVEAAQAEGLLPAQASAAWQHEAGASWVVAALGFLGAVLVSLLGLLLLVLITWGEVFEPPGSLVLALVLTALAVWMLRRWSGMFAAQLAFSVLAMGQAVWLVGWGFHGLADAHRGNLSLAGLLVVQGVAAWQVPVRWVQRLLGLQAAAVLLLMDFRLPGADVELLDSAAWRLLFFPNQLHLWLLAAAWAVWCATGLRYSLRPWAQKVSALADGVGAALLLAPLVGLAGSWYWMAGAPPGSADIGAPEAVPLLAWHWTVGVQMALVLAGALWLLAWRWRPGHHPAHDAVRRAWPWLALVVAVLLLACWVMPYAGVVGLVAACALGTGRHRLLALALVLMALQLSHFYYALQWPLADKALLLAGTGAALGVALVALGAFARPAAAVPEQLRGDAPPPRATGRRRWAAPVAIAAGAVAALGWVHHDASTQEQVLVQGRPVYVSLVPRDPRSLLQGDYMALEFDLPPRVREALAADDVHHLRSTAWVIAEVDARGVARVQRLADREARLAAGEELLPLRRLKGRWTLVTDAFFFPEGQGGALAQARFGEFRVLPGGRALLVGLADDHLQPIAAQPRTLPDAGEGEDDTARDAGEEAAQAPQADAALSPDSAAEQAVPDDDEAAEAAVPAQAPQAASPDSPAAR